MMRATPCLQAWLLRVIGMCVCAAVLVTGLSSLDDAVEVHVSVYGTDTPSCGTMEAPCASLQGALDVLYDTAKNWASAARFSAQVTISEGSYTLQDAGDNDAGDLAMWMREHGYEVMRSLSVKGIGESVLYGNKTQRRIVSLELPGVDVSIAGLRVDGAGTTHGCVVMEGRVVRIFNSTFSNCTLQGSQHPADHGGAGVLVRAGLSLDVMGCLFRACTFQGDEVAEVVLGGGSLAVVTSVRDPSPLQGVTVSIIGSVFEDSSSSVRGGAVAILVGGDVTIRGGAFNHCRCSAVDNPNIGRSQGGGMLWVEGSSVLLRDMQFWNGSSHDDGGCVHLRSVQHDGVSIVHSYFDTCQSAERGGAVYATAERSTISVLVSTFLTSASASGGGIFALAGHATINETHIQQCNASSSDGGGGLNLSVLSMDAWRMTVSGCFSQGDGGGVTVDSTDVVLRETVLKSNMARDAGGAVNVQYQTGKQRYLVGLSDCILSNNSALTGGALHLERTNADVSFLLERTKFRGNVATGSGGAMALHSAHVSIFNSSCIENSAANGSVLITDGGHWVAESSAFLDNGPHALLGVNMRTVVLDSCNISHNQQTAVKILTARNVTVVSCTLEHNTAPESGAAVYVTDASHFVSKDSRYANNVVGGSGGAVYLRGGSDVAVIGTTFLQNRCGSCGGGMFIMAYASGSASGGAVEIQDSVFMDNVALHGVDICLEADNLTVHTETSTFESSGAEEQQQAIACNTTPDGTVRLEYVDCTFTNSIIDDKCSVTGHDGFVVEEGSDEGISRITSPWLLVVIIAAICVTLVSLVIVVTVHIARERRFASGFEV